MPNGRTHDTITLITAGAAFAASEFLGHGHALSVITGATVLFSGLMFSPDLDLESTPYNRWGPLKILWWPYQKALPHRHILSHGLLIGTVFRLIYFIAAVSIAVIATISAIRYAYKEPIDIQSQVYNISDWLKNTYNGLSYPQIIAIFCGLWLGELAHIIPDYLVSGIKRSARPKRRRR